MSNRIAKRERYYAELGKRRQLRFDDFSRHERSIGYVAIGKDLDWLTKVLPSGVDIHRGPAPIAGEACKTSPFQATLINMLWVPAWAGIVINLQNGLETTQKLLLRLHDDPELRDAALTSWQLCGDVGLCDLLGLGVWWRPEARPSSIRLVPVTALPRRAT